MSVMDDLREVIRSNRQALLARYTPEERANYLSQEAAQQHGMLYGHTHFKRRDEDGVPALDDTLNAAECR